MKTKLFFSMALIAATLSSFAQSITTNTGYTPVQLVEDFLITGCLDASNITLTAGTAESRGYFDATGTTFPIQTGIMLASGNIVNAEGPNSSGSAGNSLTPSSGDPDLNIIISPYLSRDATVLEFDFVPNSDTVEFRYIFGSEEYPEWVNSSYNDVFAFFLSGPGISGPYSNNAINIALIPGTLLPVTIDNVNDWSYSQYYNNNAGGTAIEYDGYTTVLTATAVVQQCQTYHIKLAIADSHDQAYDSGVFFEEGSFSSGGEVSMTNFSTVGGNSDLWEGCTNYYLFSRLDTSDLTDSVNVVLTISGTATPGAGNDYTSFPTDFWIPAGQIYDTIYYTAFNDVIMEGTETIILELLSGCPCNLMQVTDTIYIYDAQDIKGGIQWFENEYCGITPPNPLTICGTVYLGGQPTVVDSNIFYLWGPGGDTTACIDISPVPGITWYYVTISDLCGNSMLDSIPVIVSDFTGLSVATDSTSCTGYCDGQVDVTPIAGVAPFTYSWTPTGLDINNLCAGNYSVTVTDMTGCAFDTTFDIGEPPPLSLSSGMINNDTTFCGDFPGSITLETYVNTSPAYYTWNTGPTTSSINVNPGTGVTTYWVTIEDDCGDSHTDSVTLIISDMTDLLIVPVNIPCYGDCNGEVDVSPVGGITPFTYSWTTPLGTPTSGIVNDLCADNYSVTVTDSVGCEYDNIFDITEPAELSLSFNVVVDTDENCTGEATAIANEGTPPYYYLWNNAASQTTVTATDLCSGTFYTVTITDDNGCTVIDSITPSYMTGLTFDTEDLLCNGICVGWVDVSPVGGVPPFTYSWSPNLAGLGSSTSGEIDSLCAGKYSVTVTDNIAAEFNIPFEITEPNAISIIDTITEVDTTGGSNGAIDITVTGGTIIGDYTYLWSNGDETQDIDSLYVGHYSVTITDANGCTAVGNFDITYASLVENISISQQIKVYPNPNNNGCFNIETGKDNCKDIQIKVFDITGKVIYSEKIKNNQSTNRFELKNIPVGMHFLQLMLDNSELITIKLVVTE